MEELTSRKCKWPIGDPQDDDFAFCGKRAPEEDTSYCKKHNEMAYRHNYVPKRKRNN